MSGPDLASFQAGFLAGRAHTDRAGTPYSSDIAAAFTRWKRTQPCAWPDCTQGDGHDGPHLAAPAPAVPVEPLEQVRRIVAEALPLNEWHRNEAIDEIAAVLGMDAPSPFAAVPVEPAATAWAADGHALTWPDDENPDMPFRFYESHLAEAWPDALDRQVGEAFAALRAALAAPSPQLAETAASLLSVIEDKLMWSDGECVNCGADQSHKPGCVLAAYVKAVRSDLGAAPSPAPPEGPQRHALLQAWHDLGSGDRLRLLDRVGIDRSVVSGVEVHRQARLVVDAVQARRLDAAFLAVARVLARPAAPASTGTAAEPTGEPMYLLPVWCDVCGAEIYEFAGGWRHVGSSGGGGGHLATPPVGPVPADRAAPGSTETGGAATDEPDDWDGLLAAGDDAPTPEPVNPDELPEGWACPGCKDAMCPDCGDGPTGRDLNGPTWY